MLIVVLSILILVGFAALIHAVNEANVGYEDDTGFHLGTAPRPLALEKPAAKPRSEPAAALQPAPEKEKPAKRSPRRIERKITPAGPIAAFQLELDSCFTQISGQKVGSVEKH